MSKRLPKATVETLEGLRAPAERDPRPAGPQEPSPPTAPLSDAATELRRSRARETVERYTTYAAVGGLIPLPLLDTMSVMATVALMLQAVAELYGVSLRRDRARALAASVAGGLGQAAAGSATAAALAKFVPGANLVGIMMSSVAAAALTRTIGRAFILHFETGGTALLFSPDALRAYFAASSANQPTSRQ